METKVIRINGSQSYDRLDAPARALRAGELAAMPTETVYGLAANAMDAAAVEKIFAAKGRPQDNPLIVHICALEQWGMLVKAVPPQAERLARAFWPGPLTVILQKSGLVPDNVSAGLDTVAVRFPAHEVAQELIRRAGVPLAAPSANTSGRPSPTRAEHVVADMNGKIAYIIDAGACSVGVESTVVSLAAGTPRLLRPGGIAPEQLETVLGRLEIDPAVYEQLREGQKAASPGMKYRHYAPLAHVTVLEGTADAFFAYVQAYIDAHGAQGVYALCFDTETEHLPVPGVSYGAEEDPGSQAQRLFDALRELDDRGARRVFARMPEKRGVGLAVYNRLMRAASFEVITLAE